MIITEQQLIDFISFEEKVFHPNESKHIRELTKKIGITIKDLVAEKKFQDYIKNFQENDLVQALSMSKDVEELLKAFKINASKMNFDVSGASNINCYNFPAKDIDADISGASSVKVNATKTLSVDASGASSLRYRGQPSVKSDVSGASSVKSE